MKRVFPLLMLLAVVVYMSFTGFQCSSAETTSAKLYMQQKNWAKAEESLLKEVTKNDKNEEAWYLLGATRLELKNWVGMNEAYTKALGISDVHKTEISRNRLSVWAQLFNEGVGDYNQGGQDPANYAKAVEAYKVAMQLEPDSATTYYVCALSYFAQKDNKNAVTLLETALQKKPNYPDAARFLGQVHYLLAGERTDAKDEAGAQAEYKKAATAFESAYRDEPGKAENITNLIDVYERTKNSPAAMKLTKDAIDQDPNNKLFRYAYGVFLLKQDSFGEAIEQFKKALELDPSYDDALYNLGVSYLNWGVSMKAEADKKAESEKKGTKAKLDDSYKEKFKAAIPYLEKAAERRTDDAMLWQQLGKVYAHLNMLKESKAAFEKYDKMTKGK